MDLFAEEPRFEPDRADEPEPEVVFLDEDPVEVFLAEPDLEPPFADEVRLAEELFAPPLDDELFAEDELFARPFELLALPPALFEPPFEDVFFTDEALEVLPEEALEELFAELPVRFPFPPDAFALEPVAEELFAPLDDFFAALA